MFLKKNELNYEKISNLRTWKHDEYAGVLTPGAAFEAAPPS